MQSNLLKVNQLKKTFKKNIRPTNITMSKEKKGMMFVLSSPSGAGKTTLTKKIAENNKNFTISISHTTRKPRPNEINGKDYQFVSVVFPVPEGEDKTNIIPFFL